MSFMGILGGVRICSGWGFLNIKNVETKHDYLISSLSQAWSNMATPPSCCYILNLQSLCYSCAYYNVLWTVYFNQKTENTESGNIQILLNFCNWQNVFLYSWALCKHTHFSSIDTPFCICMLSPEEAFIFGFWAPFPIFSVCLCSLDSIFIH